MSIDKMLAKKEKQFDNIELDVILKNIITHEDKGKITLVFHAPSVGTDYRKSYMIDEIKGRIDFNRVMFAIGSTKRNYDKWLNKILTDKVTLKISVNSSGFVRFIKVLDKEKKEAIAKSIFLDSIEGSEYFSEEDKNFLMSLSLAELKKEFGQ